jgi:hypothetical protein
MPLGSAFLVISFGLMLLCFAGCKSPVSEGSSSAVSRPALEENQISGTGEPRELITTFGEHRIGNTVIEANKSEGKLTVKHLIGGRSTSSSATSPPPKEWPLEEGWFAYADLNGAHVWLYNGGDKLLLVERKEAPERNVTNIYGTNYLPVPIPAQVLDHVKPELKRKLEQLSQNDRKAQGT